MMRIDAKEKRMNKVYGWESPFASDEHELVKRCNKPSYLDRFRPSRLIVSDSRTDWKFDRSARDAQLELLPRCGFRSDSQVVTGQRGEVWISPEAW